MKQSEISIGGVYIVGSSSGRGGVAISNTRAKVIEKGLKNPNNYFSKRLDHVKVVLLDDDNNTKHYADDYWKTDLAGKPMEQTVPAKFILDLAYVEAERERERAERAERQRRQGLRDELEEDATSYILTKLQGKRDDLWISARYDEETGRAEITSVRLNGDMAANLAVFCNYFRFTDAEATEEEKQEQNGE